MKTQAEADAYLESQHRWIEDGVEFSDPGERHLEFYGFKETIDLRGREARFVHTNSHEAMLNNFAEEDIEWYFTLGDFGTARLHLYCMEDPEDTGYWCEFWLKNEPWWNGDDPYECTDEQIAVIVEALPPEQRRKFEELAARKPGFIDRLVEAGILPNSAPAP